MILMLKDKKSCVVIQLIADIKIVKVADFEQAKEDRLWNVF